MEMCELPVPKRSPNTSQPHRWFRVPLRLMPIYGHVSPQCAGQTANQPPPFERNGIYPVEYDPLAPCQNAKTSRQIAQPSIMHFDPLPQASVIRAPQRLQWCSRTVAMMRENGNVADIHNSVSSARSNWHPSQNVKGDWARARTPRSSINSCSTQCLNASGRFFDGSSKGN